MTSTNPSELAPSILPRYAFLPLSIAVGVLILVPLAFYVEVGRFLAFSRSQDNWVQFATYFGGVAGPPLALIASWLVVVTVRESLNKTDQQTRILERQASMQEAGTTLNVSLDLHRNALKQVEKGMNIAAIVEEIEDQALKGLWIAENKPWKFEYEPVISKQLRCAYIGVRSAYEDLIALYMSSVSLCLRMLFELDTRQAVSKTSLISSSGPSTNAIPLNVYLAMLSEDEIRLLFLEAAYQASFRNDYALGAMLSWADVRGPIIPDWMINDMSDNTQALHDGYGAIDRDVDLMRNDYISNN